MLALIVIALLVVTIISRGYALSVLWGWFIVPAFTVPQISIVTALGLSIITTFLTMKMSDFVQTNSTQVDIKTDPEKKLVALKAIAQLILSPWMAIASGWIVLKIASILS